MFLLLESLKRQPLKTGGHSTRRNVFEKILWLTLIGSSSGSDSLLGRGSDGVGFPIKTPPLDKADKGRLLVPELDGLRTPGSLGY